MHPVHTFTPYFPRSILMLSSLMHLSLLMFPSGPLVKMLYPSNRRSKFCRILARATATQSSVPICYVKEQDCTWYVCHCARSTLPWCRVFHEIMVITHLVNKVLALQKLTFHHRVHRSPLLYPILNQVNHICNFTSLIGGSVYIKQNIILTPKRIDKGVQTTTPNLPHKTQQ
jgi:hypothetical protein